MLDVAAADIVLACWIRLLAGILLDWGILKEDWRRICIRAAALPTPSRPSIPPAFTPRFLPSLESYLQLLQDTHKNRNSFKPIAPNPDTHHILQRLIIPYLQSTTSLNQGKHTNKQGTRAYCDEKVPTRLPALQERPNDLQYPYTRIVGALLQIVHRVPFCYLTVFLMRG